MLKVVRLKIRMNKFHLYQLYLKTVPMNQLIKQTIPNRIPMFNNKLIKMIKIQATRIQIKRTFKKPNKMLKLMIQRLRNLRRVNKDLRI